MGGMLFFGGASFLAMCSGCSWVRIGIMYYQKAPLKNMVWYCILYLHLFFLPFACLLTWNTGPRLMVDSDVKSLVCLVARRNSMQLIIGYVIQLQVRVGLSVNLDTPMLEKSNL